MNDIWNQTKLNGNFLCNISEQKFLANNLNNNKFIVKYKDIFVNCLKMNNLQFKKGI